MAIDKFDIDTIPTLVKTLDTDETVVTVTVYNRVTRAVIPLSAAVATQFPAASGSWYWDVAFTTRPDNGVNQYEAFMVGTTYGQRRRILFDWSEDASLFNGVVHLDVTGGGTAGQGRYVGTDFRPSSNLADALAIAVRINTLDIIVRGALTLDRVVSGYNFIAARGYDLDSIAMANFASVDCRFTTLTLSGQLNTTNIYCDTCFLRNCLDYAGGMKTCTIVDSISKKVGYNIFGADCNAFPETGSTVTIDCQDGAGQIAMSKFSGIINVINFENAAAIAYFAGEAITITLGATVQKGIFVTSGIGRVNVSAIGRTMMMVDEHTWINVDGIPGELSIINDLLPASVADLYTSKHLNAGTLGKMISDIDTDIGTPVSLDSGLTTLAGMLTKIADDNGGATFNAESDSLNKISDAVDTADGIVDDIQTRVKKLAYGDAVWYDDYGVAGIVIGDNGTMTNPSNSSADCHTLATALGVEKIRIKEAWDIGFTLTNPSYVGWVIEGIASLNWSWVDVNGANCNRLHFKNVAIWGSWNLGGGISTAENSLLCGLYNIYTMDIINCQLADELGFVEGLGSGYSFFNLINCVSNYGWSSNSWVNWNVGASVETFYAYVIGYKGNVKINGMTDGEIYFDGCGELTIDATCVAGTVVVSGDVKVVNNSAGVTIVYKQIMRDDDGYVYLADDAITSDVFDELTAFPVTSADAGVTQIARTGADSDTLETLSDQIDGLATSTGHISETVDEILVAEGAGGSATVTITIVDGDALPIQDVYVEIWNSGLTAIVTYGSTDSNGQMQKTAVDGIYKVKVRKGGYTFNDPFDLTVSGDTIEEYVGETYIIDPASDINLCRIYGYILDGAETPIEGTNVCAVPYDSPTLLENTNIVIASDTVSATTTSTGGFIIDLVQNAKFTISIPEIGFRKTVLVPNHTGPVVLWGLTDIFITGDPTENNPNW